MSGARATTLVVANLATGLAAGVFALYAHTIMPGLRRTDDHTFVAAFTAIDRAIINPWFMTTTFLGAGVATTIAAYVNRGHSAGRLMLAAVAFYAVAVVITIAVHVPLNDAIKAAEPSSPLPDAGVVRQRFHEGRWVSWNLVRFVASSAAFVTTAIALVTHEP